MALTGPHRRGPRWVVAAGGLVATLLLIELLARLQGTPVCADAEGVLLSADPEVGWTFTPDMTVRLADCIGDGWNATVSTNAAGLADQHWPHEKRPGDVRVLLLGNHVADGLGIAREDRLSVRIAHLADQTRGSRLSVVNATIPGYATAEQLRWLERRGLQYDPDVVVLVLDPTRDPAANLRGVAPRDVEANLAPASGLLALSGAARWLGGHHGVTPPKPVVVDAPAPLTSAAERKAGWDATRKLVRELSATAAGAGARFAVLAAPSCPPRPSDADTCQELEGVAPCIDPTATFDGLRETSTKPLELCLDALGRWGRDGHFLASHALWDLLLRAKVFPDGVVRGHRL